MRDKTALGGETTKGAEDAERERKEGERASIWVLRSNFREPGAKADGFVS